MRAPPSASTQTEPSILSPSRRQSTARTGIHPLSRSFESLLKGAKPLYIYVMLPVQYRCSLNAFTPHVSFVVLRQRACLLQSKPWPEADASLFEFGNTILGCFAEPTAALMPQQQRTDAAAAVSASPVQATVRASQQTLRKRDFESELLDRLLNGAQAAVPSQGA